MRTLTSIVVAGTVIVTIAASVTSVHADPIVRPRGYAPQAAGSGLGPYTGPVTPGTGSPTLRQRSLAADARSNDTNSTTVIVAPTTATYYCRERGAYYPQVSYCPSDWVVVYP